MGAAIGLGTILQIGSGLLGAYGAYASGKAQEAAYEQQAAIADQNARTAEAQANETLERGAREEKQFRQRANQQAASQESELAASGATLSGSALTVMGDTRVGIEEDVMSLRYNVSQERYGHQVQAVDFRNQAGAARSAAKNAKRAGQIGAFGSLLGTAASFAWGDSPAKATYKPGDGIAIEPKIYDSSRLSRAGSFDPSWYRWG